MKKALFYQPEDKWSVNVLILVRGIINFNRTHHLILSYVEVTQKKLNTLKLCRTAIWTTGHSKSLNLPFTGRHTIHFVLSHNAHKSRTRLTHSLHRSTHTHEILRTVEIGWDDCSSNLAHPKFPVLFHRKFTQLLRLLPFT